MLRRDHQLKADLGRLYSFSLGLRMEEDGTYRRPDVMACRIYARQTLEDIARSQDDPFNYRLLDLWLDVFQRPWDQPTTLHQLLDDLARQVGSGDLKVYLEYDPNDSVFDVSSAGGQKIGSAAESVSKDSDEVRAQKTGGDKNQDGPLAPSSGDSPHPGLHNKEWPKDGGIEAKGFETRREVDLEDLPASDKKAAAQLKKQGWDDDKVQQVLESGTNPELKELQPGDKLYGVTSQGFAKDLESSPHWLDEEGFEEMKQKHYREGAWDREAVKNELALPCFNRADAIDIAEVTEPMTAVESEIGKATELISYTDASGSTGLIPKMMSGGGKQIAPNPSKLKSVVSQT
ncbi:MULTISPECIES: hypothetical protein [Halomonadaceae]|uniref:Uncharacterized protein n=1 Tax=Vreelandella halophila TaxID=86177 RepID=A0A9X5B3Y3_9GAMM|nr:MULTISPECIES: hypothetical protein [Halomonas]MYL26036.1 hypothetical protein [Halomonas utahensis]MYL73402.1 hypothetical protein [Halomonas sp. 22501_18_FS]